MYCVVASWELSQHKFESMVMKSHLANDANHFILDAEMAVDALELSGKSMVADIILEVFPDRV